jgi:hypothetical protein
MYVAASVIPGPCSTGDMVTTVTPRFVSGHSRDTPGDHSKCSRLHRGLSA